MLVVLCASLPVWVQLYASKKHKNRTKHVTLRNTTHQHKTPQPAKHNTRKQHTHEQKTRQHARENKSRNTTRNKDRKKKKKRRVQHFIGHMGLLRKLIGQKHERLVAKGDQQFVMNHHEHNRRKVWIDVLHLCYETCHVL